MSKFLAFFLLVTTCFADEVILKNSKVLTGKIISENEEQVVLKDKAGVELRIKKSQIQSIKTEEAARPEPVEEPKPKKKARVYRQEDLEKMPEVTVMGTEQRNIEPETTSEPAEEAEPDEAYWNREALRIYRKIERSKEAYERHKQVCDKVIADATDFPYGIPTGILAEQFEERRRLSCSAAERHEADWDKAQQEYEDLLERARKAGIPPGWVDPERIR